MLTAGGADRDDLSEGRQKIDFVWSVDHYDAEKSLLAEHWENIYNRLVEYRSKFGHCDVPHDHEDNELAKWVRTQRGQLTAGWMHDSRKAKLDAIGFSWKLNSTRRRAGN